MLTSYVKFHDGKSTVKSIDGGLKELLVKRPYGVDERAEETNMFENVCHVEKTFGDLPNLIQSFGEKVVAVACDKLLPALGIQGPYDKMHFNSSSFILGVGPGQDEHIDAKSSIQFVAYLEDGAPTQMDCTLDRSTGEMACLRWGIKSDDIPNVLSVGNGLAIAFADLSLGKAELRLRLANSVIKHGASVAQGSMAAISPGCVHRAPPSDKLRIAYFITYTRVSGELYQSDSQHTRYANAFP